MTAPDDGVTNTLAHDPRNAAGEEQQIRDDLGTKYAHMEPRTKELLSNAALAPEVIPEADIGRWQDLAKSMKSQHSALDNARAVEKAPYDRAAGVVHNFFLDPMGRIEAARKSLAAKVTTAKEKLKERLQKEAEEEARRKREEAERIRAEKEAELRRKREEEEAKAREAERIAREAREAEEKKIAEARERQRAAEEEQRKIQEAREKAEREAKEAEEKAERARKEETRRKAEAEAKAKKDEADRLAAAEKKKKDDAEAEQARLDHLRRREAYDNQLRQEVADRDLQRAERETARAERETDKAVNKEATAIALEKKVENADGGEFGRTRGDLGSVGTLRKEWTFANIEIESLDLEALRHHIPLDGLERAVRAFIKAGGRECAGVDIFEQDALQIR